jgi:site-specific DNA-methyltransferase (adenine-specific)
MKPYFERDGITIYHADCRDVLPTLAAGSVDLVLTDPPYNAGKDYGVASDSLTSGEYAHLMRDVSAQCQRIAPHQAWVAPRYQLPLFLDIFPKAHLIVIRRGAAGPFRAGYSDQFEIALAIGKPSRCIPDLWDDIRLKGEGYFFREETYGHPGYTPSLIFKRFAAVLSEHSILDPFSGTGTALVMAKALGRTAIGIERNERYCEIAARRLEQSVLPLAMAAERGGE